MFNYTPYAIYFIIGMRGKYDIFFKPKIKIASSSIGFMRTIYSTNVITITMNTVSTIIILYTIFTGSSSKSIITFSRHIITRWSSSRIAINIIITNVAYVQQTSLYTITNFQNPYSFKGYICTTYWIPKLYLPNLQIIRSIDSTT